MTQGELEQLTANTERLFRELEVRVMEDVVRRIQINAFATDSAAWQVSRLQQLGESQAHIKKMVADMLGASEAEVEQIFSDTVYKQYKKYDRAYKVFGQDRISFKDNEPLQTLIHGLMAQTNSQMERITGSMGFVLDKASGRTVETLSQFYTHTLDNAMLDIHSGAFDYNTVIKRTINDMTKSGLRWIDYESGWHNRVPVAARRAVMTGFRQVQGQMNEQVAKDLQTDSYEVTVHIGARPTHAEWEGKVYTYAELVSVCGLGDVTGLHGANCYHDYNAFIPGVSTRTYTDKQLDQIHAKEAQTTKYNGREYNTYDALQYQRYQETAMRASREKIHLLEVGRGSEDDLIEARAWYKGQIQRYRDFCDQLDLPTQFNRVYQDGLTIKGVM